MYMRIRLVTFMLAATIFLSSTYAEKFSELPSGKFAALFSDVEPETGTPASFFKKTSCRGWDYDNRSIVVDLGKICFVNEVRLEADGCSDILPHVDEVGLYVSLDNKKYTKVDSQFKLLAGNDGELAWVARFSGFQVFARYIKAHNSYGGTSTGFFSKTDHADMIKVLSVNPDCNPPRIESLNLPSWLSKERASAILEISNSKNIPVHLKTKIVHIDENIFKEYDFQIKSTRSEIGLNLSDLPSGNIEITAYLISDKTGLAVDQKILQRKLFERVHDSLDLSVRKLPENHAVLLRDMRKLCPYSSAITSKRYFNVWGNKGYLAKSNHPFVKEMVLVWPFQGEFAITAGVTNKTDCLKVSLGDSCKKDLRFTVKNIGENETDLTEVYLGTFRNESQHVKRITIAPSSDGFLGYLKIEPYLPPSWLKGDGLREKRVIIDNDGFSAFYLGMLKDSADMYSFTRFYKSTDIQGLVWCVGNPVEVNYESKIVPMRFEDCDIFPRSGDREVHDVIRDYAKRGEDTLDAAIRISHENNLFCWASLRMNYSPNPIYTKDYTPRFYQKKQNYLLYKTLDQRGKCLSYAFAEVREHVVDIYTEILDRNPDGVLVELTRYPPFVGYHPDIVAKYRKKRNVLSNKTIDVSDPVWLELKSEPMTELMRRLRNIARTHEAKTGQKITVAVHVSNSGMYEDGIDLKQWVKEDLIDVIIVGNGGLGGVSTNLFTDLVANYNIKLYGHIHAWFGGHDPTPEEEKAKAQGKRIQKEGGHTNVDVYKKLAFDYYQGGFDGVYMWDAWMMFDLITKLGDRESIYQWYYYQQPANITSEAITVY